MGLSVATGGLAYSMENGGDPEDLDWHGQQLTALGELLAEEGLPAHEEPTVQGAAVSRARTSGVPYSFLHYLRRAYARAYEYPDQPLTPVADGEQASDDPVIEEVGCTFDCHLIVHSDCEGYYVPIEFDDVLFADEELGIPGGGMVGSSTVLMRELVYVAPYLGITLVDGVLAEDEIDRIYAKLDQPGEQAHPFDRELETWIIMFEAARVSLANGTLIEFC